MSKPDIPHSKHNVIPRALQKAGSLLVRVGHGFTEKWFALTALEQKAIALILGLAILGLLVRSWRITHGQ